MHKKFLKYICRIYFEYYHIEKNIDIVFKKIIIIFLFIINIITTDKKNVNQFFKIINNYIISSHDNSSY